MLTVSMGFSLPLVINSPSPISPFVGLANGNDLVVKSSLTVVSVGSNSLPNHVCFDHPFFFLLFSSQLPNEADISLEFVLLRFDL